MGSSLVREPAEIVAKPGCAMRAHRRHAHDHWAPAFRVRFDVQLGSRQEQVLNQAGQADARWWLGGARWGAGGEGSGGAGWWLGGAC